MSKSTIAQCTQSTIQMINKNILTFSVLKLSSKLDICTRICRCVSSTCNSTDCMHTNNFNMHWKSVWFLTNYKPEINNTQKYQRKSHIAVLLFPIPIQPLRIRLYRTRLQLAWHVTGTQASSLNSKVPIWKKSNMSGLYLVNPSKDFIWQHVCARLGWNHVF